MSVPVCLLCFSHLVFICLLVDVSEGYFRSHRNFKEADWSYTGTLHQKNWERKYPACSGGKQSPINIDGDLTQVNLNFRDLTFEGWEKETSESTMIHNNGKTVDINLEDELYLIGGGLTSRYKVGKIIFHWGRCNASLDGSEHSLDGQKFPLEMQIYCFDEDRFKTVDEAMKGHGKMKALSVLFEVGPTDNIAYQSIIDGVNSVSRFGKQSVLQPFVLLSLLPNSTDRYYIYNGSLTMPPCTEMVEWIVFKDTVSISLTQLETFCEVLTMQQSGYVMLMDYLQNNFREEQYQFSGQVYSSYTGEEVHEQVCSSEPENVQADAKNYTTILVLWERPRVVYDAIIDSYAVSYQQLVGYDQTLHQYLTDGDQDTGALLSNLLPNTSYIIQVSAICTNGLSGRKSDRVIVDMPLDDPEIILFPEYNEMDDLSGDFTVVEDVIMKTTGKDKTVTGTETNSPTPATVSNNMNEIIGNLSKEDQSKINSNSLINSVFSTTSSASLINDKNLSLMDSKTGSPYLDLLQSTTDSAIDTYFENDSKSHQKELHITDGSGSSEESFLTSPTDIPKDAYVHSSGSPVSHVGQIFPEDLSQTGSSLDEFSGTGILNATISALNMTHLSNHDSAASSAELVKSTPSHADVTEHMATASAKTYINLDGKELLQRRPTNSTSNKDSRPSTASYNSGETVLQGTLLNELEMPYNASSFSTSEVLLHSPSSSFMQTFQHNSVSSVSEVLLQTTQWLFNGELSLPSSFSTDVLPFVTSPLSDHVLLPKTVPASSDIDFILHATVVSPSAEVSYQSTLSSSTDVPLLKIPPTSTSSDPSLHMYTPSETQAVLEVTTLPTSAKVLDYDNSLIQSIPNLPVDVMPHQTTSSASETSIQGEGSNSPSENLIWINDTSDNNDLMKRATPVLSSSCYTSPRHTDVHQTTTTFDFALFRPFSGDDFLEASSSMPDAAILSSELPFVPNMGTLLQSSSSASTKVKLSDITRTFDNKHLFSDTDALMENSVMFLGTTSLSTDTLSYTMLSNMDETVQLTHIPSRENTVSHVESTSPKSRVVIPNIVNYGSMGTMGVSFSASSKDTLVHDSSLFVQETLLPLSHEKSLPRSFMLFSTKMPSHDDDEDEFSGDKFEARPLHVSAIDFNRLLPTPTLETASVNVTAKTDNVQTLPSTIQGTLFASGTETDLHSVPQTYDSLPVSSLNLQSITMYNEAKRLPEDKEFHLQPTLATNNLLLQIMTEVSKDEDKTTFSSSLNVDNAYTLHTDKHVVPLQSSVISHSSDTTLPVRFPTGDGLHQVSYSSQNKNILLQPTYLKAVSPSSEDPVTLVQLLLPSKSSVTSLSASYGTSFRTYIAKDDFPVTKGVSSTAYLNSEDRSVDHQSTRSLNTVMNQSSALERVSLEQYSFSQAQNLPATTPVSQITINHTLFNTTATLLNVEPKMHEFAQKTQMHFTDVTVKNKTEAETLPIFPEEESGSGQSPSDSLSDNDTSTDFILDDTYRESEGNDGAGKAEIVPGTSHAPESSLTNDLSATIFNVSEAEASNSSHESRIGLAEGLESERKTIIPLVIVSAMTFLCLVVLIAILIYWRKCFQTAHFYVDESTSPRVISTEPEPLLQETDALETIPLQEFPKVVADLHARNGFTKEFETLKEFYEDVQSCTVDMGITSDSSNHPDNKNKNRYINIVAYDHSRVKLSQLADKDGKITDYINANYVDGYKRPKAYIAAQGPLKSTAEDFWRMIWENNVEVIVMITNLIEKGRRKCDQYWPSESSEEYGTFLITLKSSKVQAYYTVRHFTVRNIRIKKGSQKGRQSERTVSQYHYTQWPDMGVPEYTLPVLTFVRKSSSAKSSDSSPVVVHCSAGVGRTGTYIVLESMLQQIEDENTVNVLGFLKHIRTQRNYLVQTEEQYIFIHDALAEAIVSKDTEVSASHIHAYVNALLTPGPSGNTRLEEQFKLLNQSSVKQSDYSAAFKPCNKDKNRSMSIIPVERTRVCISSTSLTQGEDYINASYVMGYHQSNKYIITQHPLPHTTKDFWRMIWDHNVQTVAMLSDLQNLDEDKCIYWPNKDEQMNCDTFTISMSGESNICLSNEEKIVIKDFILEATQDDYVLEVKHYQCPKWPNPDSPISKVFELLTMIKEETAPRDGPLVVHDENGGVTAGTFCALTTLAQQLENENSVDVYQVTKMINLMRPGVFTDIDQYQFLYKAILSLVNKKDDENSIAATSNNIFLPDDNKKESLETLV
ncbi:receptor-type tyrosine-protein phosphatase zeta [Protopterus annectens]|uniref:receptor-type tyrosine-protein phosphatase zeta n=1 Tax=Protopterus annectens TaxID=7888 RepID=UPI001CFBE2DF|nr:receptor-type tyrosine-protein phosphatase zeta [Protopterus annectens]